MWKYVTRRIRDSVERTCNVLETRRTWTCGGDKSTGTGPPAGACDDQAESPLWEATSGRQSAFACPRHRFAKRSAAAAAARDAAAQPPPPQPPPVGAIVALYDSRSSRNYRRTDGQWSQGSGGRSGSDRDDDFHRPPQSGAEPGVLSALSWSGALVAGWYTSQLMSMRRRRHQHQRRQFTGFLQANIGCPYTRALLQPRDDGGGDGERKEGGCRWRKRRCPASGGGGRQEVEVGGAEWVERVLRAANLEGGVRLHWQTAEVQKKKRTDGVMEVQVEEQEAEEVRHVYRVQNEGLARFGCGTEGGSGGQQQQQSREEPSSTDGVDEVDCGIQSSRSPISRRTPDELPPFTSRQYLRASRSPSPPPPPPSPTAATTSTSTTPITIDGAAQDLLKVIGDIEFQLGVQHMQQQRFAVAVTHFKLGTGHHHAGATFNLGLCYELGLGVPQSAAKALECYVLAADLGHPKAMYNVGVFYGQGRGGLSRNRRMAREFFVAAARRGQVDAKRALGMREKQQQQQLEREEQRFADEVAMDAAGWKKQQQLMVEKLEKPQQKMTAYVPQSDVFRAVAVA